MLSSAILKVEKEKKEDFSTPYLFIIAFIFIFDGVFQKRWISENIALNETKPPATIGPLQLEITWYKIRQTGVQRNVPDSTGKCKTKKNNTLLANCVLSRSLAHSFGFALQFGVFCTM